MTHSKTKLWQLGAALRERAGLHQSSEDQPPAEPAARPDFAQTVVGNWGMPEVRSKAQPPRPIEPQRMVVIQPSMPSGEAEKALRSMQRDVAAELEARKRQSQAEARALAAGDPGARKRETGHELEARERFEKVAERARRAAESWAAAGASVGATTQLYRPDLQALKAEPARRGTTSSLQIRIPKLAAAAQFSAFAERLSALAAGLRGMDRTRLILGCACIIALALLPLIHFAAAGKAAVVAETVRSGSRAAAVARGEPNAQDEDEATVGDSVGQSVAQTREPAQSAAAQPSTPLPAVGSGTTPRAAVDALIAGNPRLAAERYEMLARSYPDHAEFAAAARILHESIERSTQSGEEL